MASDQRWTGGLANREWQSGTRPAPQADPDYITGQVRRYLADCKAFKLTPSVEGVLKVVFWSGDAQKAAIRTAYADAVAAVTPGEVSGG